jgi:Zn-dependent peptidase ImmA (M78 family)
MTQRAAIAARRLLRELREVAPPTDLDSIAANLGIEVVRKHGLPEDVSGFLLRTEGRTFCVLNRSHSRTRNRFTLAHEVGHFLLHPKKESYDLMARDSRSAEGVHRHEIEANIFAAELLMPANLLRTRVAEPLDPFLPTFDLRIMELARLFGVSREAMTYRLTNLGLVQRS